VIEECKKLDLVVTLECAVRVQDIIEKEFVVSQFSPTVPMMQISNRQALQLSLLTSELIGRASAELSSKNVLIVSSAKTEYLSQSRAIFGDDVTKKFPLLIYDIEETGKCYALERSTACAFHSIRCLEASIRALSRCLQIPDPTKAHERSWAKLLSALKAAIDKKWPSNSDRMSGDGEFFDNAYAALAGLQNPWRNATMHLDQKYTLEEAKHILEVVRGFMMRLANRMDENGLPLA
jgi:hypothetical protein